MFKKIKIVSFIICGIIFQNSTALSQDLSLFTNIVKDRQSSTFDDFLSSNGILFPLKIGAYRYEVDKALKSIKNIVTNVKYYQGRTFVTYTNSHSNLKWKTIEITYLGQGTNERIENVSYYYDKLDYQSSILQAFYYHKRNNFLISTDCSSNVKIIDEKTHKVVESYTLTCEDFFDLEGKTKFTVLRDYPYSSDYFGKISIKYGMN